ncbi:MAG TPA: hypothetical protein VLC09_02925 [Polyangiaceae bacterium]|nr:hypothetical protein [Polyangiaceae bacterium]
MNGRRRSWAGVLPQGAASLTLTGVLLTAGLLTAALLTSACGPRAGYFRAEQATVESEAVTVSFSAQDNDVFEFVVVNRTDRAQILLRDRIVLIAGNLRLEREPGGLKSSYDLPPHGSHDVHVKYDLSRIEGVMSFDVSFQDAILSDGQPVAGPVVHLSKK